MNHTLYLCYFGLREPLVQTQVLPYLREIEKIKGLKVSLLTFETDLKKNWTTDEIETEKKKLAGENINWYFLPYHKKPTVPVTIYDIFNGARFALKMFRKENVNVLHARSHIPAIMGAIAKKFSKQKLKLIFDIRGFLPEEYVDAGVWKEQSQTFKTLKHLESWALRVSDGFVILTEKAREILFPESKKTGYDKNGRPVEVIPCCVDLDKFKNVNQENRHTMRQKLNIENRFVVAYVGSLGGFYLTGETADFYGVSKEKNPNIFALILTQSDPEIILSLLIKKGFSENDFFIKKVKPSEIPLYLSAADASLSFIKPTYSKLSSSPTKNAEYLACGLPIIVNNRVNDTADQIETDKVGFVIDEFTDENYLTALEHIENLIKSDDLSDRCRQSAKSRFDLETVGGMNYRRLYNKLLSLNSEQ